MTITNASNSLIRGDANDDIITIKETSQYRD